MAAPDPVTHDRVYRAIRADILAGRLEPTAKLAGSALAKAYSSSLTPVREAMYRLVGEGLIAMGHGGFHVVAIDYASLIDVLDFSQKLLVVGVQRHAGSIANSPFQPHGPGFPSASQAVAMLDYAFSTLFQATGNSAIVQWGQTANERLHSLRLAQCLVSRRALREAVSILELVSRGERARLGRQILSHHRRHIALLTARATMQNEEK